MTSILIITKSSERLETEKSTSEQACIESIDSPRSQGTRAIDTLRVAGLKGDSNSDVVLDVTKRAATERSLLRKLDTRLVPTVILVYIMNIIDRTSVTAARLKGLEQDLHLSDIQYDTVVAILFVSYCTAQIPSNMLLNRISRPSLYIGACVVVWGLTSAMTGITHNFSGILACRVFIGFPEASHHQYFMITELAFRISLLYAGLMMSNAFGNLMAAGILSRMEGVRGIRGWRCSLLTINGSGAITIMIGFLSMWSLPDFPNNTRWLTHTERHLAQVRLAEDAGETDEDRAEDSIWLGLKLAIKDTKVLIFSVMAIAEVLGLSFTNFFPTLTSTLGYNTTVSLLLAAPPWIWASIVCCAIAYHADKTGERFFHVVAPWWGIIVGYIIAVSTFSVGGRYASLFLMASGEAGYTLTMVWVSNTVSRPPAKRAAAIAVVNGIGSLGNLTGAYVWREKWGPQYHQSMVIGIAALSLSTALAFAMRCILKRENRQLDENDFSALNGENRERIEEAASLEGVTFEEIMERKRGFRYLY
ncbi:MFS general substrate transporter [Phellopilus nigrolimitatus]|nr:MFS general substrate transporter [Phellopilus nigrolimitatus]